MMGPARVCILYSASFLPSRSAKNRAMQRIPFPHISGCDEKHQRGTKQITQNISKKTKSTGRVNLLAARETGIEINKNTDFFWQEVALSCANEVERYIWRDVTAAALSCKMFQNVG